MILIKIKYTHKLQNNNTHTHTLTRNWILIKRNYEKLWFSGKEYEYLYYNWARTSNTQVNSSNSVEQYKKQRKRKKNAIGFFLKNIILLSNNKCYNKADK